MRLESDHEVDRHKMVCIRCVSYNIVLKIDQLITLVRKMRQFLSNYLLICGNLCVTYSLLSDLLSDL